MYELFPQFRESFASLLDELEGKRVAVVGHLRPDGDSIGSQIALCRVLIDRDVDAIAISPDPIPRILKCFVGDTPFQSGDEAKVDGRLAVCVDCADIVRIGKGLQNEFPEILANIDHHISNQNYAVQNLVSSQASATAEILAGLFFDQNLEFDAITAQALFVGIATDTGQFRFPSTTQQVFAITGRLLEFGADAAGASLHLYEEESVGKLKLLQNFLSTLRFECGGKVCVGILRDGAYEEAGAQKEDSEGLVDYARAINGVEIGILVEERNGSIKGSFRSKEPLHRVDKLASQFNGGGHACAAGFNCVGPLGTFYPRMVETLNAHFRSLESKI